MNGRLDERMFGAIIRSMLDIARNSENHTWFLEKEDFTSGEFTANDWHRFLGDVAWMASQHPVLHIESVIEVPAPDWRIFCTFSMKNLGRCQTTKSHLTHLGGRKSTGMRHFS